MYFRQRWTDPRLRYKPFNDRDEQKIKLQDDMWNWIWTPDTFFRNERDNNLHSLATLLVDIQVLTMKDIKEKTSKLEESIEVGEYSFAV